MEVSADTAQSMFDFKAEEVMHWISPRQVLFIHGADDTVTPTEQSIRMWELAGQPKDLILVTGTDHFPLAHGGERTRPTIKGGQIGRGTWRERGSQYEKTTVVAESCKQNNKAKNKLKRN